MKVSFFLFASFLFIGTKLYAQQSINKPDSAQNTFRFEHFTTEQGLSENFIYSIIQDSKGYLWIGTHDGLNRYDGYRFKKFRHNPADSNSLPNNTISSICEDGQGNIWLATNGGLCRFNPDKNNFIKINLLSKILEVQQVMTVTETELLVKYNGGISYFNTVNLKETIVSIQYNGSQNSYLTIFNYRLTKNKKGEIYSALVLRDGYYVWQFDKKKKIFIEKTHISFHWKNKSLTLAWYYSDNRNNVWFGPLGFELSRFNHLEKINEEHFNKLKYNSSLMNAIFEDDEGSIWLATVAGLYFYNNKNDPPLILQNKDKPGSISSDIINAICQDRTGIIWIGTANGLNKLNPNHNKFRHHRASPGSSTPLFNNFILGVYAEDSNTIRISYNFWKNHISRFNVRQNSIVHFSLEKYDYKKWIRETVVQNLELLTDSLLNIAADSMKKHAHTVGKPTGKMFIDNRKNIWYIYGRYLLHLNSGKHLETKFSIIDAAMKNEEIWMATGGEGLICFNTGTQKITNYNSAGKNRINSNDVTSIIIEENGNVWAGTKGGGLNYFNRKTKTFQYFTEEDGLCNNSIYSMVKDNNGKIWLGTSNGLSCFDPESKKFKNYFRANGLVNSEYNRQSACKLPDGTIFMGGMNGIDYFHPDSLLNKKNIPQVLVTDFKVFNKNIAPGKNLSLNHNENFITFEFAAMDFNSPSGNIFSYKLEGVDKDWVLLENRNFTTYSYLKPGNYRFLVKAANSDGVWNDEPAEYRFNILPAWYQTWWFFTFCILSIAGIIYALFKYRLHQKLRVLQIRNRLHRDLHDDIGATLSSVKAYSEILRDNPNNQVIAELIKDNSTEMLERLEVISWATNPQHDHFKSLKNLMIKLATPLCHSKNIQCHIESKGVNEEMLMSGEIRQNIFLVFKEAINNMIKYAEATECVTRIFIRSNLFVLQIADNGKGFDGITKGTGSGWKNMQKRAEELSGKLEIDTDSAKGTVITMSLPYPFKIPNSWDRNKH